MNDNVVFLGDKRFEGEAMECPHCESNNLHQSQVQLYCRTEGVSARTKRESNVLIVTSMYDGMVSQCSDSEENDESNPSPRRQGMRVIFSCENCDNYPQWVMFQHKGQTYTGWEV